MTSPLLALAIIDDLLAPLKALVCLIKQIGWTIAAALILAFNELIVGVGSAVRAVIGFLPGMPDPPQFGDVVPDLGQVVGMANWFFPLSTAVQIVFYCGGLMLAVLAVSTLLRWLKVIQ